MIISVLISLIGLSNGEECSLDSAEIYCGMETMSIRVPACAMENYGSVVLEVRYLQFYYHRIFL